jgi:hypothetical protein
MLKYSSRFWLYAPISAFLLLAAAAMIHWWMLAQAFEKKLAALKGHQAIPGVTLDWSSVAVGGFPFRLDADFTNLRVQGAGAHGPFGWTSGKFALHTLTYGRRQIVYEAAGRQTLSWTAASGNAYSTSFLPGTMRGSTIQDGQGLRRLDLDIVDVGDKDFTIGRFQFHMRRGPADLDLMLRTDGLALLGLKTGSLQLYATLQQADALMPLMRGDASWPDAVAKWRSQGGSAKLSGGLAGKALQLFLSPLY